MKANKSIIIAGVCLLTISGCNRNNHKYDAAGIFEATEIIVSAEANGKLMQFDISEGEKLKANELVGYIDTVQLWLKILQLQANDKSVNNKRADISKQIAATQEQIATQKREKNRCENLLKSNAANQKQLDYINSQITVLEKQLAAQISTLENTNNSINNESSAITIQIAQLKDQLTKCHIFSPIEGTVLAKYAEPGELATTGRALFKIADIDHLFLRAYLTSDQLSSIKIGQQVTVTADFGGKQQHNYQGIVSWISSKAEFTPKGIQTQDERANLVYAVKIAVKNDGYIKIGMYGEISFSK